MTKRSKNTRDEHGNWDAGGGGLKFGQSLEDNLKREILEEYNVVPIKIDFIGYLDAFRKTNDGTPTHCLAMYFAVRVDPATVKINEPDMVYDHGWFTLNNLPSPMNSQFEPFMQKHGTELRKILTQK